MSQTENSSKIIPMTDLQRAYYIGSFEDAALGGSFSRSYFELETQRYSIHEIENAIIKLIKAHELLHCRIRNDMNIEILDHYDIEINVVDYCNAEESPDVILADIRDKIFNNTVIIKDELPVKFYLSVFQENCIVIHIYGNGMVLDGWSHEIILEELEKILGKSTPEKELGFNDYINVYSDSDKLDNKKVEELAKWLSEAKATPSLPLLTDPANILRSSDLQVDFRIHNQVWDRVLSFASGNNISVFSILITIYGKVLERYSNSDNFLLNIPIAKRPYWIEGSEHTIGLCSDFSVFRYESSPLDNFYQLCVENHNKLINLQEYSDVEGMRLTREIQKINGEKTTIPISLTSTLGLNESCEKSLNKKFVRIHTTQVWIETFITNLGESIQISMNFVKELFDYDMAVNIAESFYNELIYLASNPIIWGKKKNISLCKCDKEIIHYINDTKSFDKIPMVKDRIIHNMYKYSEKIAVASEELTLTYAELNSYSFSIFNYCKALSFPIERIGIYLSKGWKQIVAAVAAICGDVVYMPLDPDMTALELKQCDDKVKLSCIITEQSRLATVCEAGIDNIIDFDVVMHEDDKFCKEKKRERTYENHTSIIINTSGSTGQPKSIALHQEGISSCLYYTEKIFGLNNRDTAFAITNFCHDMAIFDTLGLFWLGGTIVVPSHMKQKDPKHWIKLMKEYNVTVWNSVPALMEMLLVSGYEGIEEVRKNLKVVIHGGDWLSPSLAQKIISDNKCNLYNVGGPTETTIWNIYHKVSKNDISNNRIPYGRPFPNTKYYILNDHMDLCPIGVPGIMYVVGVGVAQGYVGLKAETEKKFVYLNGEHIYNTGDIGRYLPEGNIEILGRTDNQIKINGKRVELNGIEAVVNEIPGVVSSVVVKHFKTGKLIAFYISTKDISEIKIKEYLSIKLSEYLIPQVIVSLDEFPLTANGKVDRKGLSNYVLKSNDEQTHRDKPSTIGAQLLSIVKEVLCVDSISEDDNFFALGGDSVSAMKVVEKVEISFNIELSVYDILNFPILSSWVEMIESADKISKQSETITEEDLLMLIRKLIGNNNIGITDDFMEIGGSLDLAKEISEIIYEKWCKSVSPYQLVSSPYLEDWIDFIDC